VPLCAGSQKVKGLRIVERSKTFNLWRIGPATSSTPVNNVTFPAVYSVFYTVLWHCAALCYVSRLCIVLFIFFLSFILFVLMYVLSYLRILLVFSLSCKAMLGYKSQ
jgi:hypothetical protein